MLSKILTFHSVDGTASCTALHGRTDVVDKGLASSDIQSIQFAGSIEKKK